MRERWDQTYDSWQRRGKYTAAQWRVMLQQRGLTVRGEDQLQFSCPNTAAHHRGDQRPSFSYSPVKGIGHCFRCGAVLTEDQLYAWVGSPRVPVNVVNTPRVLSPYRPEWPGPLTATHWAWLQSKGVTDSLLVRRARLGSDPERGLGIPWCDGRGRLLWVNWRPLRPDRPKYLADKGAPKRESLYGWHLVPRVTSVLVVVEAELDALHLLQYGYPALAMGGLALSPLQVEQLQRRGAAVILWPDGDEAGQEAIPRLQHALRDVVLLPFTCPAGDPKQYGESDLRTLLDPLLASS